MVKFSMTARTDRSISETDVLLYFKKQARKKFSNVTNERLEKNENQQNDPLSLLDEFTFTGNHS